MSAVPNHDHTAFQFSMLARKEQQRASNQDCATFDEVVAFLTNPKVQAAAKETLPLFFPGVLDTTRPHAGQRLLSYCMAVGDYDGGVIDVEEAGAQLRSLGIKALIVPTASWTPAEPRWRVIAPLACQVDEGTAYVELVDRLNACLQGVLAPESWKRKTGWFYGSLQDRAYANHVLIGGRCLDEATEIKGQGLPESKADIQTASAAATKLATFDVPPGAKSIGLIGSALAAIKDVSYDTWIDVTFALKAIEQHQIPMRAIWADWTQKHARFREVDLKKWDTIHPQYAHWGRVFEVAKEYGWIGGTELNIVNDVQEYLTTKGADFENRYWAKYTASLNEGGRNDMLLWRVKRCEKGSQALKRELGEYITAYTMAKRQYGISSRTRARLDYREDVTNTASQTVAIVQAVKPRLAGFELVHFAEKLCAIRCVEEADTKPTTSTTRPRKYQIRRHSKSSLTAILEQHIVFSGTREDSGMPYAKAIPEYVLDHCLTGHDVLVPSLHGLINHPIVLGDGRIVSDHGYDAETKLFNTAPSISYRACTDKAEAKAWLAELLAVPIFSEVAYATPLDAAAGVAILLTQVNRKAYDKAPGALIVAPTAGSGKTTFASSCVEVATGFEAVTRAWPFGDEMNKTIVAVGRSGVSAMIFDNLGDGAVFKSDALDGYLTTKYYASRILGESTDIEIPATAMVYVTGNNIKPGGALATRLLPVNLNTKLVNPTKKTYKNSDADRFATIIKHRARILEICAGILAWSALDRTYENTGRNRYPMWDRSIGHAIRELMEIDVSEAFDKQFEASTSTEEAQQLIQALIPMCESAELQGLDPFLSLREITALVGIGALPPSVMTNGRNGKQPTFTREQIDDLQMCYEEARSKTLNLHSKTVGAPLSRIVDVLVELNGRRATLLVDDKRKGGTRWFRALYIND